MSLPDLSTIEKRLNAQMLHLTDLPVGRQSSKHKKTAMWLKRLCSEGVLNWKMPECSLFVFVLVHVCWHVYYPDNFAKDCVNLKPLLHGVMVMFCLLPFFRHLWYKGRLWSKTNANVFLSDQMCCTVTQIEVQICLVKVFGLLSNSKLRIMGKVGLKVFHLAITFASIKDFHF